jgi:hypothetical protein
MKSCSAVGKDPDSFSPDTRCESVPSESNGSRIHARVRPLRFGMPHIFPGTPPRAPGQAPGTFSVKFRTSC